MRILLIEENPALAQSIELTLKSRSMHVYTTDLGEEGIDLAKKYQYDMVIVNSNLPDMSGYEVIRTLRLSRIKTAIMMLSQSQSLSDTVRALGFGADDYMSTTFHADEITARINAITRRYKGYADNVISIGPITMYTDTHQLTVNEKAVSLTDKEYQILELLAFNQGKNVTKDQLHNHLYGGIEPLPKKQIIDVFICKLRKKLSVASNEAELCLQTIWGRGYCLTDEHTNALAHEFASNAKGAAPQPPTITPPKPKDPKR